MSIFNIVTGIVRPAESKYSSGVSCGNITIMGGAKALIGSTKDDKLKDRLRLAKDLIDDQKKRDMVFKNSKEFNEWSLNCERVRLVMLDEDNLFLQNEINSRVSTIEAIMAAINDTFNTHDASDQIKLARDLNDDPTVKKFLNTPFGLPMDYLVDIITCKLSDRAEDHTFEDFRAMCKTFLQKVCALEVPHIKWVEVMGDKNPYHLSILFTPADEFLSKAKSHGFKYPEDQD